MVGYSSRAKEHDVLLVAEELVVVDLFCPPNCGGSRGANPRLIDDLNLISDASEVGKNLNQSMRDALEDRANVVMSAVRVIVEFVQDKDNRKHFIAADGTGP